jgi:drug/metabolite transporter (DMT)-like permease
MVLLPENKALRAGLLMVCAMASFVSNDTIIKVVGSSLPTGEIIAVRGVIAMLIIGAICARQGVLADVAMIGNRNVMLRNVFDLLSTVAFVTALMHMQIANLTAVMQAVPLAVALLSMVFLKEKVGPRRMAAIAGGFIGVLMIVKPSTATFNLYDMLALIIVFCVAIRDLLTKRIPARVPTFVVALGNAGFVTAGGALLCVFQGALPIAAWQFGLLALAACFLAAGYLFMVATLRLGDLSGTAPFRYSIMVFAILSGIAVFHEFPDWIATLGMALIVASGLYAAHREAKLGRAAALSDSARRPAR